MKRSLNIGINDYPGTGSDLSGCRNDANDWREVLEARGFKATSLLDSAATKSNMHEAISKIVGDTGRDDIAVITYSGHGTWVPDEDDPLNVRFEITARLMVADDELPISFATSVSGASGLDVGEA